MSEYRLAGEQSKVEISGKSSLHPIHGQSRRGTLTGWLRTGGGGDPLSVTEAKGRLELPLAGLSFGSALYDRELPGRLDTRRYPTAVLELLAASPVTAPADRPGTWRLSLSLTVHGVTVPFEETAVADVPAPGQLTLSGSHQFSVRDFGIKPPKMLGMKVHPEFEVAVHAVGELAEKAEQE